MATGRSNPLANEGAPAGIPRRAAAAGIDAVLIALALVAIGIGSAIAFGVSLTDRTPVDPLAAARLYTVLAIAAVVLPPIYFAGFGARGTPGKRRLDLVVVTTTGSRIGPLRSVLRCLGYAISLAPAGLGFALAAVHPRRRALHDLLVGTEVRRRSGAPVAAGPGASPIPSRLPEIVVGAGLMLLVIGAAAHFLRLI